MIFVIVYSSFKFECDVLLQDLWGYLQSCFSILLECRACADA